MELFETILSSALSPELTTPSEQALRRIQWTIVGHDQLKKPKEAVQMLLSFTMQEDWTNSAKSIFILHKMLPFLSNEDKAQIVNYKYNNQCQVNNEAFQMRNKYFLYIQQKSRLLSIQFSLLTLGKDKIKQVVNSLKIPQLVTMTQYYSLITQNLVNTSTIGFNLLKKRPIPLLIDIINQMLFDSNQTYLALSVLMKQVEKNYLYLGIQQLEKAISCCQMAMVIDKELCRIFLSEMKLLGRKIQLPDLNIGAQNYIQEFQKRISAIRMQSNRALIGSNLSITTTPNFRLPIKISQERKVRDLGRIKRSSSIQPSSYQRGMPQFIQNSPSNRNLRNSLFFNSLQNQQLNLFTNR